MDTKNVKLFDANNNLVPNFEEEIEKILISIHGENYYDIDEDLINTNLIPVSAYLENDDYHEDELEKTIELVDAMVDKNAPKINIVENKKKKITFMDFVPLLFFIIIFAIIVVAGQYFLNTVDLGSLLK